MAEKKTNTVEKVREIIQPIADDLGLEIWDVRYLKEGVSWFLRIFIEKEDGITIDDCETFSRAINDPLDEADPIKESYYLEVSSPGLGRELTKPEHFERFIGEEVALKLIRPIDGKKEFIGKLCDYENGSVIIELNGEKTTFEKSAVSKINLNDFDI